MSRTRSPATDKAVLDAAIEVLLTTGYSGLRMEEVAARAAVSKRTLYKRYANKEDLIAAAAQRLFSHLRSTLPTAPRDDGNTTAALAEFAKGTVDFLLDPTVSGVLRVVISESGRQPLLGTAFVENGKAPIERLLADFLRGCADLDIPNPEPAAAQFLGMLKEVTVWPQLLTPTAKQSPAARKSAIEAVVDTFVRAHARD